MKRRLMMTALAAFTALGAGAAQADYTLHVLHINDFHSRIAPIDAGGGDCAPEAEAAGDCFGGIARLAGKVNELRGALRAEGQNVILLDAGDQYQGSLFHTTYKGAEVVEFMNAIGFDAMAVGNHEFDEGPDGLRILAEGAGFPVIAGNLDLSRSDKLRDHVGSHVTLTVGGERVGIVSALSLDTPEISSPGDEVIFRDDLESLRAQVAELTEEGVERIIALTHSGHARDQIYAGQVAGIDAVIGGHSHTLLGDMDGAEGPYPTLVEGVEGAQVPVATAYAYGKYLGHLVLTWDDAGRLIRAEGAPVLLDASVPPDPQIAARIAEMSAPIEALRQQVVAHSNVAINGDRRACRVRECEMGNVVAEAMLDRVRVQGISIAIMNAGGIRASIDEGPVTMGEVLSVLPFRNTLSTFRLTGADIVTALENGASRHEEQAGRFAQVAGLKYTVDPAAPAGARISEVMVREGAEWVPIDRSAEYGVVSNDYLRNGGDGYAILATAARDAYDFGPDISEALTRYLARHGPGFIVALDGRITVKASAQE